MVTFRFEAVLWEWSSSASWVFLSLPTDVTDEIRERSTRPRRGFGSIPVAVSIGDTSWTTSVFPHSENDTFILPVKKAVRAEQGLSVGDSATVKLSLEL